MRWKTDLAGATTVLVLAFAATSANATPYSAAVLADNPTAYYRLDETSGTTAVDSTGNNTGSTYNATGVTLGVPGGTGSTGAEWNGTAGYASLNYTATGSFSVEVWAKSNTTNWNQYGWIASDREADGFIIHPFSGGNQVGFYVMDNATTPGYHQVGGTAAPTNIQSFNQYALTYDNTTGVADAYIDGALVETANIGAGLRDATSSNRVLVGQDDCCGGRFGNGVSDDLSIYNTVLSPAQIAAHFNAVPEPASVALFASAAAGMFIRRHRM